MDGFDVLILFAVLLSTISFFLSVFNLIENRAAAKSTHRIDYVRAPFPGTKVDDQGFEELSEEDKKKMGFIEDDDYFN